MEMMSRMLGAIVLLLIANMMYGQVTGIETEEVQVVKSFEATLRDATKVAIKPKVQPVVPREKKYRYKVTIVPLEINYPSPEIKPQSVMADLPYRKSNFFIKGGYGTLDNAHGDLYFGSQVSDLWHVDLDLHHRQLTDDRTESPINYSKSYGNIKLTRSLANKTSISLYLDGKYHDYDNYFNLDNQGREVNQAFDRIVQDYAAAIEWKSIDQQADGLSYRIRGGYQTTMLNASINKSQDQVGLDASLRYGFNSKFHIDVPLSFIHTADHNDELDKIQDVLVVRPQVSYTGKSLNINLGLGYAKDYTNGNEYMWPVGRISYAIGGKYLAPFVQSSLITRQNSLSTTLDESPWASLTNGQNITTFVSKEASGGLRGELGFISYSGEVGYREMDQLWDYQHTTSSNNRLVSPITKNPTGLYTKGSLDFAVSSTSTLGASMDYFMTTEELYIPKFTIDVFTRIAMWNSKLVLTPSLSLANAVTAHVDTGGELVKTNEMIQLNGDLQFWPSKNIGIYLQGVNLLDNRYVRWAGYPVPGIHFSGGIAAKF